MHVDVICDVALGRLPTSAHVALIARIRSISVKIFKAIFVLDESSLFANFVNVSFKLSLLLDVLFDFRLIALDWRLVGFA